MQIVLFMDARCFTLKSDGCKVKNCIQMQISFSSNYEASVRNRSFISPQLKVSRWLLDLAFLKELTAKLSAFNAGIQSESSPALREIWEYTSDERCANPL